MITGHAKVHQPSSLARTIGCTGWIKMSAGVVQEETEEAREGTAAHWVVEQCLEQYKNNVMIDPYKFENKTAPNGVIVTEAMIDAATFHINDVINTVENHNHQRHMLSIEQTVDVPQVHPEMFGTGDTVFYCRATNKLFAWDFKYGHRRVPAYQNWQLMCYVIGAMMYLNVTPQTIVVRVVQPRCFDGLGNVLEWVTNVPTMHDMAAHAKQRCAEADSDNATCTPGPWCRDCPATFRCAANQQAGASVYEYIQYPVQCSELDNNQIVLEYELLERLEQLLKSRKDGVEEDMKRRMKSGTNLPSYSLEKAMSRENWKLPPEQVITMLDYMGVDARKEKPLVVKTPNQVRQDLKRLKIDAEFISTFAGQEVKGLKLIKNATNRARLIFKESMKNG